MLKSVSIACLLAAAGTAAATVDNALLPEALRVPAGHMVKLETLGIGEITYECREKNDSKGTFEWTFVAPVATLFDMQRNPVGKYYGGPTWEALDGSKVTGKQVAVAPSPLPGSIPLQLVRAEPATGSGAMNGVTFIQRLDTKAGVAPVAACNEGSKGAQRQVAYEARYVFYTR